MWKKGRGSGLLLRGTEGMGRESHKVKMIRINTVDDVSSGMTLAMTIIVAVTDGESPHRCCRLPNNFGSRRIFPLEVDPHKSS